MFKKIRLILFPVILFCILVSLCGILKLIIQQSKSAATDMVYVQSGEYQETGKASVPSFSLIITTKCESLEIYTSQETISDVFDLYIDDKISESDQYITASGNEYLINYSRPSGALKIVINSSAAPGSITVNAPVADIDISGLDVTELIINNNAGFTGCSDITAESIIINSQSGSVNVSDSESTVTKISCQNGKIFINSWSREFYLSNSSGDIEFIPVDMDLRADLTTVSGNIKTHFSDNDSLTVYIKQKGGMTTVKDGFVRKENSYVKGDGYSVINISTDTGDITIE